MTRGALDYSQLAALYDDYCVFSGDIPFFRSWAESVSGEILELMAGTGRISLPLLEDGARLTAVDNSMAMLAVLAGKLRGGYHRCRMICADVCRLPIERRFSLVILPFHGFGELGTEHDRLRMLREVSGRLSPEGRFVCTSHNPAVRLRQVDGTWHEIGEFAHREGGTVSVALRERYDEPSGRVAGEQRLRLVSPGGAITETSVDLCFSLVSLDDMIALAEQAGLSVLEVYGDYERSGYQPDTSPAIVAAFARARETR